MVKHGVKLCGLTNFSVSWHVYPLNVWRTTFKADLSLNATHHYRCSRVREGCQGKFCVATYLGLGVFLFWDSCKIKGIKFNIMSAFFASKRSLVRK